MSTSHHAVNPWTWQDQFGFAQAISAPPWLFCAGQGPADPDGNVMHPGDIGAQLTQSLDNLETVLAQAGTDLSHVVRLNYYTTDVDGLFGVWHLIAERLQKANCRPAQTLLGVARLAFPDMLIEIEATALLP
jgi:enamine deaminase RidA (YjgF/YER057c/UK114 family)